MQTIFLNPHCFETRKTIKVNPPLPNYKATRTSHQKLTQSELHIKAEQHGCFLLINECTQWARIVVKSAKVTNDFTKFQVYNELKFVFYYFSYFLFRREFQKLQFRYFFDTYTE